MASTVAMPVDGSRPDVGKIEFAVVTRNGFGSGGSTIEKMIVRSSTVERRTSALCSWSTFGSARPMSGSWLERR